MTSSKVSDQLGSTSDTSLFISRKHGRLLLVLIYIDDILITGDDSKMILQIIIDLE